MDKDLKELPNDSFTRYRRKQVAELRPWQPGDNMAYVSVSSEDARAGSPKKGDMIARNPKNHADQWLVAATYFADNFEPEPAEQSKTEPLCVFVLPDGCPCGLKETHNVHSMLGGSLQHLFRPDPFQANDVLPCKVIFYPDVPDPFDEPCIQVMLTARYIGDDWEQKVATVRATLEAALNG